jgi:hypothetical protein
MKQGYVWAIRLGGFGSYQPTEIVYSTLEELKEDIATRYPEYLDYYGVDLVQDDGDGFWDIVEEIKTIPQTYYEKEEGAE